MDTREALRQAKALMHIHGLDAKGWTVDYDRAVRSFGKCNYRTKTITLSRKLTETAPVSQVLDTILHEIAHAMAGFDAGHGPLWKSVHRSIGGNGQSTGTVTREQSEAITYKWVGKCLQGHEYRRHRLTKAVRYGSACPRCPRYLPRAITWTESVSQ